MVTTPKISIDALTTRYIPYVKIPILEFVLPEPVCDFYCPETIAT